MICTHVSWKCLMAEKLLLRYRYDFNCTAKFVNKTLLALQFQLLLQLDCVATHYELRFGIVEHITLYKPGVRRNL